jgi:hypothetical protein
VWGGQALFAPMVVDAVSLLDPQLLDIKMVRGGGRGWGTACWDIYFIPQHCYGHIL